MSITRHWRFQRCQLRAYCEIAVNKWIDEMLWIQTIIFFSCVLHDTYCALLQKHIDGHVNIFLAYIPDINVLAVCGVYVTVNICVTNDHGYVLYDKWPRICSVWQMTTDMICRSHNLFLNHDLTRVTRCGPLVKQELSTLPEHLSVPLVFSEVQIVQYLVFCAVSCLSSCSFTFGHVIACR